MAKLSDKVRTALNQHLEEEFSSAYAYLAASAHFKQESLPGMASWMRVQAEEELRHAGKFYDHILARGGKVELQAIPKPRHGFGTPVEVFEDALAREEETTRRIDGLYELSVSQKDHPLQIFLQWFVQEQVEEEETLRHVLDRFGMAGPDRAALLLLDTEMGNRPSPAP